jgi:hypothetical protein
VVISIWKPALLHADGAEGAADFPEVVRPLLDDGHGLVRRGVGGEIEVRGGPPQEEVAHRPAHQRQLEAGIHKALPELEHHRIDGEVNGVKSCPIRAP